MGEQSRRAGNDFEKIIEQTFEPYSEGNIAHLDFYPVPMRPTGQRDKFGLPLYAQKGKAPFDVWGFCLYDGRFIGAELKSSKRKTSLPIILPTKKGDGVQWHQLCALRNVAVSGGIARLVWSNEGEVGVIREKKIVNAWAGAWTAMRVEDGNDYRRRNGRKTVKAVAGFKSIKWEEFEIIGHQQIDGGGLPVLSWLRHELFQDSFSSDRAQSQAASATASPSPAPTT